jgi:hypothetical protein
LSPAFAALLKGPRTSPQTRAVLHRRLSAPAPITTGVIPADQLPLLRALVACIIPTPGFDLTARLAASLVSGPGDGWRFDALPADAEAWRTGLASLDAAAHSAFNLGFVSLYPDQQHALLQRALDGDLGGRGLLGSLGVGDSAALFTDRQMQQWFEDVRTALARLYAADPRTLDRIGFTGFADEEGFSHIQLGQPEVREA